MPPNDAHIMDVGGANETNSIMHNATNSVYALPYKQQQLEYMHQVFTGKYHSPVFSLFFPIITNLF